MECKTKMERKTKKWNVKQKMDCKTKMEPKTKNGM